MASQALGVKIKLWTARDFVEQFTPFMKNLRKEIIKVALLDPKLQLLKELTISKGSLNSSIVHPREVMIPAIKESAASIVLIHNHPSGDPVPVSMILRSHTGFPRRGISLELLLNHIIIGGIDYYSFSEEGLV